MTFKGLFKSKPFYDSTIISINRGGTLCLMSSFPLHFCWWKTSASLRTDDNFFGIHSDRNPSDSGMEEIRCNHEIDKTTAEVLQLVMKWSPHGTSWTWQTCTSPWELQLFISGMLRPGGPYICHCELITFFEGWLKLWSTVLVKDWTNTSWSNKWEDKNRVRAQKKGGKGDSVCKSEILNLKNRQNSDVHCWRKCLHF